MGLPDAPAPPPAKLGLVLTGGGARGAYQAGVLCHLAQQFPELKLPIITGVSAGAINAAHLANHPGSFQEAVGALEALWRNVETDKVFQVEDNLRLAWKVFRRSRSGLENGEGEDGGLFDTTPLRAFLEDSMDHDEGRLAGVERNVRRGRLEALAITTLDYQTGQNVTWIEGKPFKVVERPNRRSIGAGITLDHVMASAALPFLFPAVKIGADWHGDGGVRLAAPLSPALRLGASHLLAISTRYDRSAAEASEAEIVGYPPAAQIIGILMNAIFLDMLERDARTMERINTLIRALPPAARHPYREVKLLLLRPSVDLAKLAKEYEGNVTGGFSLLGRVLGSRKTKMPRWLSMVMFDPAYIEHVMQIGQADAEAQSDRLAEFMAETQKQVPARR